MLDVNEPFNIASNDFDVKKSASCMQLGGRFNRTRFKQNPMYPYEHVPADSLHWDPLTTSKKVQKKPLVAKETTRCNQTF